MSAGMSGAGGSAGPRRAPQSWLSVRVGSSAGAVAPGSGSGGHRWARGRSCCGGWPGHGTAAGTTLGSARGPDRPAGRPGTARIRAGHLGRTGHRGLAGQPCIGGRGRPRRPVSGRWRGRHRARVDNDGGATWHHHPLPGVTATTRRRGAWARASDPVVAFGPDGAAYVSTLVFDTGCDSGVLVSKSIDGGRTFAAAGGRAPQRHLRRLRRQELAGGRHRRHQPAPWSALPVLDTVPDRHVRQRRRFAAGAGLVRRRRHHLERAGQRQRPARATPRTRSRCSDPTGRSSTPTSTTAPTGPPRDQRPPPPAAEPTGPVRRRGKSSPKPGASTAYPVLTTAMSTDGGATWHRGGTITRDLGNGPPGFRCCLPSATADPGHRTAVCRVELRRTQRR